MLSHLLFTLAHAETRIHCMACDSLLVSWLSGPLGGAAAPVMGEPGLQWRRR